MRKKQVAQKIQEILDELFPDPAVPLKHKDSYTLLIAVLLSARCTDERVNRITPALFAKADTPQKMVTLSYETIQDIIRPCGLSPTKSKAIKDLSQILLDSYDGAVPGTLEELEELPGVGHKTASVVMCQAFKEPAFPVDTHIHRLAKRWGLSSGKSVKKTEEDLKKLFPREDWIRLHLQIIYFARTFCPAIGHEVKSCPICSWIAP
ncbi:MAG: endonuclease III [Verrucomicrobia bacterium]|nr:endonuclease III [Verrucomicrobiota bacterium]